MTDLDSYKVPMSRHDILVATEFCSLHEGRVSTWKNRVSLVSVYVNEKFCNKNVCLDLFSVVLIVLP